MKILIAYSSKTNNTKKIAVEIYETLKDTATIDLLNIKKQKNKLDTNYDLYILGCWVDKGTLNKKMMNFIQQQNLQYKKVALFMTCGVPKNHNHALQALENYKHYLEKHKNEVIDTFICQGKIDPKILLVFKVLSWKKSNFIHKINDEMLFWIKSSQTHPDMEDIQNIKIWANKLQW